MSKTVRTTIELPPESREKLDRIVARFRGIPFRELFITLLDHFDSLPKEEQVRILIHGKHGGPVEPPSKSTRREDARYRQPQPAIA